VYTIVHINYIDVTSHLAIVTELTITTDCDVHYCVLRQRSSNFSRKYSCTNKYNVGRGPIK